MSHHEMGCGAGPSALSPGSAAQANKTASSAQAAQASLSATTPHPRSRSATVWPPASAHHGHALSVHEQAAAHPLGRSGAEHQGLPAAARPGSAELASPRPAETAFAHPMRRASDRDSRLAPRTGTAVDFAGPPAGWTEPTEAASAVGHAAPVQFAWPARAPAQAEALRREQQAAARSASAATTHSASISASTSAHAAASSLLVSPQATPAARSAPPVASAADTARWQRAVLDALGVPLLVCSAEGHLLMHNRAAEGMLQRGRWLQLRDGRIGVVPPSPLADAVLAAARRGVRQLVPLFSANERIFASVSPLPGPLGDAPVLLLLGRGQAAARAGVELLANHFHLTEAERRVLCGLADNVAPADLAVRNGVALSTVRSQVSSVHAKLGVRSGGALLGLVGGLPPLAGALAEG